MRLQTTPARIPTFCPALEDYGAMRREIKRPMTERAKKQLCNRLDKLAGTAAGKVELLNEANFALLAVGVCAGRVEGGSAWKR